jgi:hypothetical protein
LPPFVSVSPTRWFIEVYAIDTTRNNCPAHSKRPSCIPLELSTSRRDLAYRHAEIVRAHPQVRRIAAGDVHRAALTSFAGVMATICPAPNHAVNLDLGQLREPSFKVEPPAFHLHLWSPGESFSNLVTHTVPIGEFDGPHPFFGPDDKLL